jgi:hypothetical protein
VVKTGKTPVLKGAEWRKLLNSMATTLRDLCDGALIARRAACRRSHAAARSIRRREAEGPRPSFSRPR